MLLSTISPWQKFAFHTNLLLRNPWRCYTSSDIKILKMRKSSNKVTHITYHYSIEKTRLMKEIPCHQLYTIKHFVMSIFTNIQCCSKSYHCCHLHHQFVLIVHSFNLFSRLGQLDNDDLDYETCTTYHTHKVFFSWS